MATVLVFAATGVMLAAACGGAAPAAPTVGQSTATALAPHKPGTAHALQPKNLEAMIEIDMYEFYFANPQGEKNPTFRLPAGKTVGIHVHNEGAVVHELAIGRKLAQGEYQEVLTELVPSDLFFYYGAVKAEVEDAKFGEMEVESGVRDIWIRMNIPAELKGEWELGCFVEGHYEQGMAAKLIIE
jgi:uncharacterized cupredoxin-like copper-binding protein